MGEFGTNMGKSSKVLVLLMSTAAAILAQPVKGRLLIQHQPAANPKAVAKALASFGAKQESEIPGINVHVIQVPEQALEKIRANLLRTGLFTFAEPDFTGQSVATPNDPNYPYQWHLPTIQAPAAWDLTTGSGVTIAIVDSGVDPNHPDLAPNLVGGKSYIGGGTSDVLGHGTAVAGAAAAVGNNLTGVTGVSWGNRIMPLVVLDSTDYATYSNIASAITYAADSGARIINVSIGGSMSSSTLQSAVTYAWNKGSIVFASAGNNSNNSPLYPAACDNVVAVSATNSSDQLASFSNYGNWIDLSAPGDYILTTTNGGGYGYWQGTSFASPIAASVGALVLSRKPSLSASGVVSILENNADDLGSPGFDQYFGWGRVNVYRAVAAASGVAGDSTAPSVSISGPGDGATVSGTIQVQGTASDNVGVVNVELYVDNQLVTSTSSSSFNFSWNTASVSGGTHTLTVKAYDAVSNVDSASMSVNVNNVAQVLDSQPPAVSIMSPSSGSAFTSGNRNTQIMVGASDNVAVTRVSIYVDGTQVYSGSVAPFTYNWNLKKVRSGTHTITAKAWDAAGNSASATPVSVTKQ